MRFRRGRRSFRGRRGGRRRMSMRRGRRGRARPVRIGFRM